MKVIQKRIKLSVGDYLLSRIMTSYIYRSRFQEVITCCQVLSKTSVKEKFENKRFYFSKSLENELYHGTAL